MSTNNDLLLSTPLKKGEYGRLTKTLTPEFDIPAQIVLLSCHLMQFSNAKILSDLHVNFAQAHNVFTDLNEKYHITTPRYHNNAERFEKSMNGLSGANKELDPPSDYVRLVFSDGSSYVGQLKKGRFHGQGTLAFPDGMKYTGQFKMGKGHGQGALTYPDGKKYVGQFKNGKGHGQGTLAYPTGRRYIGEFKNGKCHRKGTFTSPFGYRYEGQRKNGKYHGLGTMVFPEGYEYTGQWKDGMFHGQGTLTYPDGFKYTGKWKEGRIIKET